VRIPTLFLSENIGLCAAPQRSTSRIFHQSYVEYARLYILGRVLPLGAFLIQVRACLPAVIHVLSVQRNNSHSLRVQDWCFRVRAWRSISELSGCFQATRRRYSFCSNSWSTALSELFHKTSTASSVHDIHRANIGAHVDRQA
jgi:hypothetical protein